MHFQCIVVELLAGWLWPLLAMHSMTIANDSSFMSSNWLDYVPKSFWPVLSCGLAGSLLFFKASIRKHLTSQYKNAFAFFFAATGLAVTLWLCASRIGLADIRFYPYALLLSSILCGWLLGEAFNLLTRSYKLIINIVTVILTAGLLCWIMAQVEKAPHWSAWNHNGYEDKQAWQQLSHLFPVLQGNLNSPRLLFEHDPLNNDIGSTRALEALPLFLNQRPVLEGLYMESALLAPVVYQLQAEVSRAPSSPLTRFPSGSMDIKAAAAHMQLLHSNEVLTRSLESQAAIESSGLFNTIGIAPPFKAYRLKSFSSKLVSLVDLPVVPVKSQHWKKHAFDWFKSYPLINDWPVYTDDKELNVRQPEVNQPGTKQTATISNLQFEREKISFTTDQLNQPHLIKIAYHPRWKLLSSGQVYLAAPGYLLIIPEANPVTLVYEQTLIGKIGLWVSIVTAGIIMLVIVFQLGNFSLPVATDFQYRKSLMLWLGLMLLLASYSYYTDPERIYKQGWQQMNARNYSSAASYFDRIISKRQGRSRQEEVLFWSAKAYQQAGNSKLAMQRYQQLVDEFNGYWLPESIYTLAELHEQNYNPDKALQLRSQLKTHFPQHRFTPTLNPE